MLWTIPALVGVFFVFKGVLFGDMRPSDGFEWILFTFFSCLFSLLPIGACVGGAALCGLMFDTHPVLESTDNLVAIRDKDGVTGHFFLGSGMIESEQYYFYYRTNSDGSVTPDKVRAGQGVRVYEEDRSDAKLESYRWETTNSGAWLIALPVNDGGWSFKFYVPKGTVRTGYTM
jgi:hypothetical protein